MEELLTVDQIADVLKVPKSWVYSRTRENSIPMVKVGKYRRFKKSEVLAWVKKQYNS